MADFSYSPETVNSLKPKYFMEVTKSENGKLQVQQIDSAIEYLYELDFGTLQRTTATGPRPSRDDLVSHYEGQTGIYTTFSWTNPPSYIRGYESPMTVRYWDFSETPVPGTEGALWKVKIVFRKEL